MESTRSVESIPSALYDPFVSMEESFHIKLLYNSTLLGAVHEPGGMLALAAGLDRTSG